MLSFSNQHAAIKPFLVHFFLSVISFVQPRRRLSSAPTTNRYSRRAQGMSRLAALRGHRQVRPLHDRARRQTGGVGPKSASIRLIEPSAVLPITAEIIVLFAVECLVAASWADEGFGAAMSRAGSPRCRGRNRAVAEARPGRDDVSPRRRKAKRSCLIDRRRPLERPTHGPHAMQNDCKFARDSHRGLL